MRSILTLAFVLFVNTNVYAVTCDENADLETLEQLFWVAEDYPPYNYIDEAGQVTGIFTDVLLLIYQELGLPLTVNDIQIMPWARLYNTLTYQQNTAGFSMTSTPARKERFKLVELPFSARISIMVKQSKHAQITAKNIDNITIAVVREDIGHHLLNSQQISAKQVHTTTAASMLKMLEHERVDAIAYSEDVARFQSKKLAMNSDELVSVYNLIDDALNSYAFNRNISTCATQLFTRTVEQLNERGELETIFNHYLH